MAMFGGHARGVAREVLVARANLALVCRHNRERRVEGLSLRAIAPVRFVAAFVPRSDRRIKVVIGLRIVRAVVSCCA